jgi:hypothetical protein
MSSYFEVFSVATGREKYPLTPAVIIRMKATLLADDGNGSVYLSPHLMTDREIDEHVDRLQKELERVRQQAKQRLRS